MIFETLYSLDEVLVSFVLQLYFVPWVFVFVFRIVDIYDFFSLAVTQRLCGVSAFPRLVVVVVTCLAHRAGCNTIYGWSGTTTQFGIPPSRWHLMMLFTINPHPCCMKTSPTILRLMKLIHYSPIALLYLGHLETTSSSTLVWRTRPTPNTLMFLSFTVIGFFLKL